MLFLLNIHKRLLKTKMFITFCKTREEKKRSNTFPGPSPKPSPEV